jgi:hypothetical protein
MYAFGLRVDGASVSNLGPSTKPAVFLSPSGDAKNRRFSVAYIVRQPGAAVDAGDPDKLRLVPRSRRCIVAELEVLCGPFTG